ncbi:MAG: NADPH-dependent 7-cyano-7-deazaguanine reductase QueF [Campylobacterales bacterium]
MKYGEEIIANFDVEKDLEIWPNEHKRDYIIKMTLPEFSCLCPRSGYPDYATIYLEYTPDERKLKPKWMKLTADFNPRGNVHTVIEIDSRTVIK